MDLKNIAKELRGLSGSQTTQHLSKMLRSSSRYRSLDKDSQSVVLNLAKKYNNRVRSGVAPSRAAIQGDKYHLFEDKSKLGFSKSDLSDINGMLDGFKGMRKTDAKLVNTVAQSARTMGFEDSHSSGLRGGGDYLVSRGAQKKADLNYQKMECLGSGGVARGLQKEAFSGLRKTESSGQSNRSVLWGVVLGLIIKPVLRVVAV
ncbi:hypothetical protein GW920_02195 [Candidatus Falkowbacteria bacterium]|nr:hypothetical protein [Candidatus Falkowbacteria bacterium]OIO05991.1 MAG: hypothetical protein AUJ26_01725 [Candidatus Falkowbacteria bacterium CG1_02_37_21]